MQLIGSGTFGIVYKALDTFTNQCVAIKLIGTRVISAIDPSFGTSSHTERGSKVPMETYVRLKTLLHR